MWCIYDDYVTVLLFVLFSLMLGLGLKLSLGVVLSSCLWQASPLSQSEYRKEDKETRGKEEGITCNPKCHKFRSFCGSFGSLLGRFLDVAGRY